MLVRRDEGEDDAQDPALKEALAQAYESEQRCLRALADLENYKKRSLQERSDLIKYQGEQIFNEMLDIADNFDRALENADADPAQLKEGLEMIHKMLGSIFDKFGVRAESALGQNFDPQKHAALSQVPDPSAKPGEVVGELKKAYFYKDKLLRPAEVVVAKAADEQDEAE